MVERTSTNRQGMAKANITSAYSEMASMATLQEDLTCMLTSQSSVHFGAEQDGASPMAQIEKMHKCLLGEISKMQGGVMSSLPETMHVFGSYPTGASPRSMAGRSHFGFLNGVHRTSQINERGDK